MTSSEKALPERRTRSLGMVKKLVSSRQEMLSLYNLLASKKPFTDDEETLELLSDFCASLIDYTANAHFQLYRYFAENRERRSAVQTVADRVYPRIVDLTQDILDFNDKYDTLEQRRTNLAHLAADLSTLGERLAERIDLEEDLVDIFTGNRRQRAATG